MIIHSIQIHISSLYDKGKDRPKAMDDFVFYTRDWPPDVAASR